MVDLLAPQTVLQVTVAVLGAVLTCLAAWWYSQRVRLDRPLLGVFNGRDIIVLFAFITTLPVLYLALPHWALTAFLLVTFTASLSIGYRPLLPRTVVVVGIGVLLGTNVYLARTMLGTVAGWQLYWAETSALVLLGAAAVANLYVQGGMRLRHVAWFVLGLGCYDFVFSALIPLTPKLADAFIGYPLDPSIGMRVGVYSANIGIGDLLAYALFTVAALKAYGPRAARPALAVVALFGAVAPAVAPLVLHALARGGADAVVPAQTFFCLPAFAAYLAMRRRWGAERTAGEFFAAPVGN